MLKTIDGKDCKVVPSAIENLQEIVETKNTFFFSAGTNRSYYIAC